MLPIPYWKPRMTFSACLTRLPISTVAMRWLRPSGFTVSSSAAIRRISAARYYFGLLRFQQGRYEEALLNFDRVLAKDPGHRDALYNRATTLAYMGRPAEALPSFERLLTIEPGHFEALYNRGIALWRLETAGGSACRSRPDFGAQA
jgi:tetratricopeptide (TPR) repeat protein